MTYKSGDMEMRTLRWINGLLRVEDCGGLDKGDVVDCDKLEGHSKEK